MSPSSETDSKMEKERENNSVTSTTSSPPHTLFVKVSSCVFYGVCSFLIVIVNKTVLTSHKFPSFQVLGIGQMVATIVVLSCAKQLSIIKYPNASSDIPRKIFPLPVIFLGNLVFGLGGTKKLSLPMFTVLRRFSILMTMAGQYFVLGQPSSFQVQGSVYAMILGALVAASNDLSFDIVGYVYILLNDFFTAANGIYVKKKMDHKDLGKYGLMFYNSLFMLVPAVVFAYETGELDKAMDYPHWTDAWFLSQFLISCIMGFILTYSIFLCTFYNSALTTTVIGCLKNIIVTYIGMVIGGDYIFSWTNFIGLNISIAGSLWYTFVTFSSQVESKPKPPGATDEYPLVKTIRKEERN